MKIRKPTGPYKASDIIFCRPYGFRISVYVNTRHDLFIDAQAVASRTHRERVAAGASRKPVQRVMRFNKPGWRKAAISSNN